LIYRLSDEMRPIGKPDDIGFTGKFLVDAHKRDKEYLANIEALHTFRHRFDRVVKPVEAIEPEVIERECQEMDVAVPDAWAVEEEEAAEPEPPAPTPMAFDPARMTNGTSAQNLGH